MWEIGLGGWRVVSMMEREASKQILTCTTEQLVEAVIA
jgi:hypothetical protein